MTPEQWQQLLSTLGDAGSQLYAAAARQAKLDAFLCAIVTYVLITMTVILVRKTIDWHKHSTLENDNEIFVFISSVFIAILVPLTYLFAYKAIAYLLNPQWAIYETIAGLMQ